MVAFPPLSVIRVPALVMIGTACHVRPDAFVPTRERPAEQERSAFLRGEPGSFVVLGDAGSFAWPTMLQDLLADHARHPGTYAVLNASVAAPGIAPWLDRSANSALTSLEHDYLGSRARLRGEAPAPRSALCIVTLAGLGDVNGPVRSETDMLGAERGADALERLARDLHAAGVERVVFATPLFTPGCGPEASLEHVALARLLERGLDFVAAGPDLYRASRRFYPDAYRDGVPNEFALKLVAEEWYRWLAGPEASEDAVQALYARAYDVEAIEASFARTRGQALP